MVLILIKYALTEWSKQEILQMYGYLLVLIVYLPPDIFNSQRFLFLALKN